MIRKALALLLGLLITSVSHAQVADLLPMALQQFFDNNGNPLTSGTVTFYVPNTTTLKTTWQDANKAVVNPNPITLNAGGKPNTGKGIYGDGTYRQVVKDRLNNLVWDAVTAPPGASTGTLVGDGNLVGTILSWGGIVAPNQYAFAYGQELNRVTYSDLLTAITIAANVICTNANNTLTGLSDTTQIPVGAAIELTCVPAGTTVVSKTGSTVVLSNPSNISLNTVGTFFPYGNGNGSTTFNVPDLRDLVIAGRPNMGGTDRGLLTTTYYGANPAATGARGGSQNHTLSIAELAAHTHPSSTLTDPGHIHATTPATPSVFSGAGAVAPGAGGTNTIAMTVNSATTGITLSANTGSQGSSTPFATIQPTITLNYIIKITPDVNSSSASGVASLGGMTGVIACGSGLLCTGNIISATGLGGDVIGPISAINNNIPLFNGTSGKLIKDSVGLSVGSSGTAIKIDNGFGPTNVVYFPAGFVNSSIAFGNGFQSLSHTPTVDGREGYYNTCTGILCGMNMTTGYYNTGSGFETMEFCTTCNSSAAFGEAAMIYNITGNGNSAFGFKAGLGTVGVGLGDYNTVGGANSMITATAAVTQNTAWGAFSLNGGSFTGNRDVAIGYRSGVVASSASDLTLVGPNSGDTITTSPGNVCVGKSACSGLQTGTGNNTMIGNVTSPGATTANTVIIADGAGNVAFQWTLGGGVSLGGQLLAASGGTGLGSFAVGDILYAGTTSTLARLAGVATGNALISGGVNTAPSYGKIGLTTHVSGILTGANGGTGVANTGSTITLGGNLTTSGAFATTLTVTGTTSVTLPTSGTLVNSAVTSLSSLATVGTITSGIWNAGAVTSSGDITAAAASALKIGSRTISAQSGSYQVYNGGDTTVNILMGYTADRRVIFTADSGVQFDGLMTVFDPTGVTQYFGAISTGTTVYPTTTSTSKTTGSLINKGGFGNAGTLFTDTLNIITVANASTTRALCWDNTTGLVSENGTVGTCTVSTLAAKNLTAPLMPREGFDIVMAMEPWRYTLKEGLPTYKPGEQIGFIAEYALQKEPRLVAKSGEHVDGFLYEQYTAALTGAIHYMQAEIEQLKRSVH